MYAPATLACTRSNGVHGQLLHSKGNAATPKVQGMVLCRKTMLCCCSTNTGSSCAACHDDLQSVQPHAGYYMRYSVLHTSLVTA